jgi:hypothetical protein
MRKVGAMTTFKDIQKKLQKKYKSKKKVRRVAAYVARKSVVQKKAIGGIDSERMWQKHD